MKLFLLIVISAIVLIVGFIFLLPHTPSTFVPNIPSPKPAVGATSTIDTIYIK